MDYDDDLVKQKKIKQLAARHDSLPLVFGIIYQLIIARVLNCHRRMIDRRHKFSSIVIPIIVPSFADIAPSITIPAITL